MESKNRQRDYLFDNYKVLLIILVIIGHFTEPSYRNNDFFIYFKMADCVLSYAGIHFHIRLFFQT